MLMTISEAMIAISALFATVWPKIGPIVSKLKLPWRTPYFCCRSCWIVVRWASVSVGVEIWKPLPPATSLPLRRWISASPKPAPGAPDRPAAPFRGRTGRGFMGGAGLEVDPKLKPFPPDRERPDEQDHAGEREEPLRRAHEVEALPPVVRARAGAEGGRVGDKPAAAHRAEHRLRQEHRRAERHERADAEREREALDPGRREDEEDERHHERDDVRVDDRRQALLVARRDAGRHRSPGADLLLDALEDDDVRVGRDADREDQARDARERHRDRDELDQRVEVDGVDEQRADRDDAEDPVEDQQEDRDDHEARDAGDEALVERLLAERRGDLRRGDQLQLDRQRAGLEQVRQALRGVDREAARDLRAVGAVDAVGVLLEVDERDRDELVVEHDGEVLLGGPRVLSGDVGVGAALGDRLRRLLERLAALVREAEGDDRLAGAAGAVVELLLGVLDLLAAQRRVVAHEVVEVALPLGARRLGADDDRAPRDLEPLLRLRRLDVLVLELLLEVAARLVGPGDDLLRLRVDLVEEPVRRGVRQVADRALARARDRGELVGRADAAARRGAAGHVRVLRRRLAVGVEDVPLPVVEVHLRRRADLVGGLVGVLDVGQGDVDLVGARALDLGLGDAELVDALAHDVERAVDRVARDPRLDGRLRLVGERHTALQVEAEARRLRQDHDGRRGDQGRDEQEDEEIAAAVGHGSRESSLFRRREHEEQPAVVVVGGEEVGGGAGRQIALRVDLHGVVEGAHAPLEDGGDGIVAVGPAQAEHLAHLAADDALVVEARQLERPAPAADHAPLGVAHEEGGVGSGVVVVEELEQEREAALAAGGRLTGEAARALGLVGARAAVRADEQMGHALPKGTRCHAPQVHIRRVCGSPGSERRGPAPRRFRIAPAFRTSDARRPAARDARPAGCQGRSRYAASMASSPSATGAGDASARSWPRTTNSATRSPASATPTPTVKADWKPATSASACRLPDATWSPVTDVATADNAAIPSAPPTCWDVLIRPEASPASEDWTPASAAIEIGTNEKPMPTAMSRKPGRRSLTYEPPTDTCVKNARPAVRNTMPVTSTGLTPTRVTSCAASAENGIAVPATAR